METKELTYGKLSTRKKLLIGGLGALTAPILSLLNLENEVLSNATALNIIGVILRIVVLFYIGAFVVWLHTDENSPVKVFELGIAAPALLSLLVAGQIPGDTGNPSMVKATTHREITSTIDISLVSSAFAGGISAVRSNEDESASPTSSHKTVHQTLSEIYEGLIGKYGKYSSNKESNSKKVSTEKERRRNIERPSVPKSP